MEVTRTWKVYGANGHRQRASFAPSATYDWSSEGDVRKVALENADMTGTNEYVIIRITRNTAEECERELDGQISDGFFENCVVGKVIEVLEEAGERKQAKWESRAEYSDYLWAQCSECGFQTESYNAVETGRSSAEYVAVKWHYCPKCGAEMSV